MPLGCPTPLTITYAVDKGVVQVRKSVEQPRLSAPYPAGGRAAGPTFGAGAGGNGFSKPMSRDGPSIHKMVDQAIMDGLPGSDFYPDETTLYVTGLPSDTVSHDLYIIFACFGAIAPRGAAVYPSRSGSGTCCGWGFVQFLDARCAEFARQSLNGRSSPDGTTITVKRKGPPAVQNAAPMETFAGGPPSLQDMPSGAPFQTSPLDMQAGGPPDFQTAPIEMQSFDPAAFQTGPGAFDPAAFQTGPGAFDPAALQTGPGAFDPGAGAFDPAAFQIDPGFEASAGVGLPGMEQQLFA